MSVVGWNGGSNARLMSSLHRFLAVLGILRPNQKDQDEPMCKQLEENAILLVKMLYILLWRKSRKSTVGEAALCSTDIDLNVV